MVTKTRVEVVIQCFGEWEQTLEHLLYLRFQIVQDKSYRNQLPKIQNHKSSLPVRSMWNIGGNGYSYPPLL